MFVLLIYCVTLCNEFLFFCCISFWATVGKTVCPILSECCLYCTLSLSFPVCSVSVLWPSGWMDQDDTWLADRPWPWHIVLDGDPTPSPQRGRAPNFWPISVVARWLDGSRCHVVGSGDPAPLPKKGAEPQIFGLCCGQMALSIKMKLGMEVGLSPGHIELGGDPTPPAPKRHSP